MAKREATRQLGYVEAGHEVRVFKETEQEVKKATHFNSAHRKKD